MRHDHDPLLCFHHRHLGYHLKLNLQKEVFNCARGISVSREWVLCVLRAKRIQRSKQYAAFPQAPPINWEVALRCVRSPSSSTCYRESRRRALVKPSAVSPDASRFCAFWGQECRGDGSPPPL